jgi:Zn-dependent protease
MDKNDYQGYYDSIWEEIEPHKRKGENKKQKQTGIPVVIVIIVAAVLFLVLLIFNVAPVRGLILPYFEKITGTAGSFIESSTLLQNQKTRALILTLIPRVFVLLVCFPVHECAHAWTAYKLGDYTAKMKGRISLNPFKHLTLIGSIMILAAGVGYAKPVPVNPNNFNNRKSGMALTAFAGPLSNMIMTILFLVLTRWIVKSGSVDNYYLMFFTINAAYINVSLALFNMIPIPPLDGSKVFGIVFTEDLYDWFLNKGQAAIMIVLVAVILMSRSGFNPLGIVSDRAFDVLYRLVVAM